MHDAHSSHRNYYQLHVSDMSFCFERCRLIKNYQAFQELCPFYCVFYLPKMWWIHLDLGFLKCLLFIVTRLEKPHKFGIKVCINVPQIIQLKYLYYCSIINDQCSSTLHTSCSMKTYKTTYSLLPQTKSHQPWLYANMAQKFSIHST